MGPGRDQTHDSWISSYVTDCATWPGIWNKCQNLMSWPIGLLKHYTQAYFAGDYFCLKFVHFFQGELDYIIQPKDKIVFISTLHGG